MRALLRSAVPGLLVALALPGSTLHAQGTGPASSPAASTLSPLVGTWRSDTPLANGGTQDIRFSAAGVFELATTVTVDGQYRLDGNRLVQTLHAPGASTAGDTATIRIAGDSMFVTDARGATAGGPAKALVRESPASAGSPLVGMWRVSMGTMTARYHFETDGSMHVTATVGMERGTYELRGDTLRLANDASFSVPAVATVGVRGDTMRLVPIGPKATPARTFHRVAMY